MLGDKRASDHVSQGRQEVKDGLTEEWAVRLHSVRAISDEPSSSVAHHFVFSFTSHVIRFALSSAIRRSFLSGSM